MSLIKYRPHPLLRNGHLQTLMVGVISGRRPHYQATSRLVPLADGESIVVHEEMGGFVRPEAPLVIMIHGLGGDHRSAYLERLAPRLRCAGFHVWRVDLRGCGLGLEHAWRPANAGSSSDLADVVSAAADWFPKSKIHVVGFSLSGNILLKMLGEFGTGTRSASFDQGRLSATAIAPPANLHDCADNMDKFSRGLYTRYYLKVLDQQVQLRQQKWKQWQVIPRQPAVKTIRQFDSRFTAPLSGYRTAEEYYSAASSAPLLSSIQSPTHILVDRDDPVVTAHSFESIQLSPMTSLEFTRFGGHMGYFGLDDRGRLLRWMEEFVVHRLKKLFTVG